MIEVTPINKLNAEQSREYNRAQALNNCFVEQANTISIFKPFDNEVKLFFQNQSRLIALCPGKNSAGTIITRGKDSLKTDIAVNGNIICTRTAAYAFAIGDKDLQEAVYHSFSSIYKLADADVLSFITRLTGTVSPLLSNPAFAPYAITAEMLDTLTKDAVAFNSTIGKASFANSKKSYYSEAINKVLKAIRGNVVQFRLLINFYEKDYPEFVKEYRSAVAIDHSGIRHSGIGGTVINSLTGAPVEDATITAEGKNKIARTDSKGIYKLVKLKITAMKVTISAPGYDTRVVDVKIIRGKIQQLNFELKGKLISISATA